MIQNKLINEAPTDKLENKKVNLPRRSVAFRPADPLINTPSGKSLLVSQHMKSSDNANVNKGRLNNNGNSEKIKTPKKIRKPVNRIVLSSYIKSADKKTVPTIGPLLQVKSSQNASNSQSLLITNNKNDTTDLAQNEDSNNCSVIDIHQQNTELILSNNLNKEQLLTSLENGGLGESQLLVGDGSEQRYFWLCPIINCNKLYSDRFVLHIHILSHFGLKSVKCNIDGCSQEFISDKQLHQHTVDVHKKQDDDLIQKIASHVKNNKKETVQIIDTALASVGITNDKFQSKMFPGDEIRWLCCYADCELTFKTQYLLKNHLMMHYNLKPFKCNHENCKWAFQTLHKLNSHSTVHRTGQQNQHVCSHSGCRKTFSNKYNLLNHMKFHEQEFNYPCPANECKLGFTERSELEIHLKNDHTLKQAVHECGSCGKRFWWTRGMVSHIKSHLKCPGEPICPWPGCGRRFEQARHLRYHLRLHTDERPYKCKFPSCQWAFHSAGKLSRHARKHTKERRYSCEICEKAFFRLDHLNEHLTRHLPHQKYQCDFPGCEQIFSNSNSLYAHKVREHNTNVNNGARLDNFKQNNIQQNSGTCIVLNQSTVCEEDVLSLRSARTHVPWATDSLHHTNTNSDPNLSQLQNRCDEKQGNPLVCGGLGLEGEGPVVGAGLTLEVDGSGTSSFSELGTDLLGPSGDNMNSLLLQEELSDTMLYTTEDDAALHVFLLSEDVCRSLTYT